MKILAWVTVGVVYFLMFWGNLVSSTGSGLACPDYPLCYGTITPPARFDVILEWGHRLIAAFAGVLILATIFTFLRSAKSNPFYKGALKTVVALLFFQIALGGITVLLELSVLASTIHLVVATLVFSGLMLVAFLTTYEDKMVLSDSEKLKKLASAATVGLLVQFTLGALVRHGHAGMACPSFPLCTPIGFLPETFNFATFVAFTHRWWGIILVAAFLHLIPATKRHAPKLFPWAIFAFLLVLFQVLLGIGTVVSGLNTWSRAIHAGSGYLLWWVLFYIAMRSGSFQFLWKKRA